jgi:hypothetical protein
MSDIESMLDEEVEPAGEKAAAEDNSDIEVEAEELDLTELEEALDVEEVSEVEEESADEDLDLDLDAGIEAEIAAEEGGVELETEELEDLDLELDEEPELEAEGEDLELEFISEEADQEEVKLEEVMEESISAEEEGDEASIDIPLDDETAELSTEEMPHVMLTEDEEDVPKKPPKPVKKKGVSKPVLALLIIVLLAGGAIFGLPRLGIQVPYVGIVADMAKNIPFIGKFFGSKVEDPGNLRITTFALTSKFVENSKSGTLFVITGKARNDYSEPRGFIKVTGRLYTKGKKLSKTTTVFCGNKLSDKQLAGMDLATIEKKLLIPGGQEKSNMGINPGKFVSFMIVFPDLPSDLDEFSVEVEGSQVTGK